MSDNQRESAETLLNAAVGRFMAARTHPGTGREQRSIARQAQIMMTQAGVHATLAVLDRLESLDTHPSLSEAWRLVKAGAEDKGMTVASTPDWAKQDDDKSEQTERSVYARTRDDLIRFAEQFPEGTWFQGSPNGSGAINGVDEQGRPVKTWFWYPQDPTSVIQVGARVRKFNYSSTGTVDRIDRSQNLAHVKWDNTGESWGNLNELGVVTAGTDTK